MLSDAELQSLISRARSGDDQAVFQLGKSKDPRALETLAYVMRHGQGITKFEAARALGNFGEAGAAFLTGGVSRNQSDSGAVVARSIPSAQPPESGQIPGGEAMQRVPMDPRDVLGNRLGWTLYTVVIIFWGLPALFQEPVLARRWSLLTGLLGFVGATGVAAFTNMLSYRSRSLDNAMWRTLQAVFRVRLQAVPAETVRKEVYNCSRCRKQLEEIGVPPAIQFVQQYKQVINIGATEVPEEIKRDPFLYRGLFCPTCRKAFCPTCCQMQTEICPECGQKGLMPAYRPLLKSASAGAVVPPAKEAAATSAPEKPVSQPKCESKEGCCPFCGTYLLDEKGNLRIYLDLSKQRPGEQGFFCPKCRKELEHQLLKAMQHARV